MFCVVAIVLLSSEADLSIVDVETQQSQAGAGRDTDRVPDTTAPGGKDLEWIHEPQDGAALPGKPEHLFVKICAAIEGLITGHSQVAS